jgi:branched-chain amino acid transport system permease protein
MFLQEIINGITLGSVYALIALGYTMVYGVLGLINFAHGEIYMVGAYAGLVVFNLLYANNAAGSGFFLILPVCFAVSMLFAGLLGVSIEKIAYKPLRNSPRLAPLITALGVSIVLQNSVMLIAGSENRVYPDISFVGSFKAGNVSISYIQIFIILISLLLMFCLRYFVQKTRLGKAMRAVSQDKKTASLMGINIDRVISITFFLGSSLAAAAGIMVGLYYNIINFSMGYTAGLKAFTAAVLGGIGSIPGAMLGGLILGVLESLGAGFISSQYKDVFAFVILITVLIIRPNGILGNKDASI